jgi:hypothetical protein
VLSALVMADTLHPYQLVLSALTDPSVSAGVIIISDG